MHVAPIEKSKYAQIVDFITVKWSLKYVLFSKGGFHGNLETPKSATEKLCNIVGLLIFTVAQ